jgi:hypothetical protein
VLDLTNPVGYRAVHPDCDLLNGDIHASGATNFDDISPFVALLSR